MCQEIFTQNISDVQHVRQVSCEPGFPQPSTRRHHSAVVHDDVMYVYGGHIDLKGSSSEMWAFHVGRKFQIDSEYVLWKVNCRNYQFVHFKCAMTGDVCCRHCSYLF